MNQTISLYRLQQADTRSACTNPPRRHTKALEDDRDAPVGRAQAEVAEKETGSRSRPSPGWAAVQSQTIKIEQADQPIWRLDQNPKELQDLQKDIISLKHHRHARDRLLEAMLAPDQRIRSQNRTGKGMQAVQSRSLDTNQSLNRSSPSKELETQC